MLRLEKMPKYQLLETKWWSDTLPESYFFQSKPLILGQAPPPANRIGRLRGHETSFPVESETMRRLSSMAFGQVGHEARLRDYFDFLNISDYFPGSSGYKRDLYPDRIMQHKMKIRDRLGHFSNNEVVILLGQNVGRTWRQHYGVGIRPDQKFTLWTHEAWGRNFFHQPKIVVQIPHPSSVMGADDRQLSSETLRKTMRLTNTYQVISAISEIIPVEWRARNGINPEEIT